MKNLFVLLIAGLIVVVGLPDRVLAQASTETNSEVTEEDILYAKNDKAKKVQEATKEVLDKVMRFAQQSNYDGFGKLMIYSGRDPNRTMRVKMNPNDAHERLEIENSLNFIRHWLKKSALYHTTRYRKVTGLSGDLFYWEVEFTLLNGKSKKFIVVMSELNGKYLFVRMDKA